MPPDARTLPSGENASAVTTLPCRKRMVPIRVIAPGGNGSLYESRGVFCVCSRASIVMHSPASRHKPTRKCDMASLLEAYHMLFGDQNVRCCSGSAIARALSLSVRLCESIPCHVVSLLWLPIACYDNSV